MAVSETELIHTFTQQFFCAQHSQSLQLVLCNMNLSNQKCKNSVNIFQYESIWKMFSLCVYPIPPSSFLRGNGTCFFNSLGREGEGVSQCLGRGGRDTVRGNM